MRQIGIASAAVLLTTTASLAHYSMLLPDKPWAEKGEKVTITYQYGHPYEHELAEAPQPEALVVINPKGEKQVLDVAKTLKPIKKDGADGKKVTAWQLDYTPADRGDYTFALRTALLHHDDKTRYRDLVRVVLHVQTQNGWDTSTLPFGEEIVPHTRPYGLLPGMIFKGQVVGGEFRKPRVGVPIEFEKYNEKPPKKVPPDELITFKTKTDEIGSFVVAFPEAGWWGITGTRVQPNNVDRVRVTSWVHVDEKK